MNHNVTRDIVVDQDQQVHSFGEVADPAVQEERRSSLLAENIQHFLKVREASRYFKKVVVPTYAYDVDMKDGVSSEPVDVYYPHLGLDRITQKYLFVKALASMPWFRLNCCIVTRASDGADIVVRGNWITREYSQLKWKVTYCGTAIVPDSKRGFGVYLKELRTQQKAMKNQS